MGDFSSSATYRKWPIRLFGVDVGVGVGQFLKLETISLRFFFVFLRAKTCFSPSPSCCCWSTATLSDEATKYLTVRFCIFVLLISSFYSAKKNRPVNLDPSYLLSIVSTSQAPLLHAIFLNDPLSVSLSLSLSLTLSLVVAHSRVEVPRSKHSLSCWTISFRERERERETERQRQRRRETVCAFYLYSIALLGSHSCQNSKKMF